MENFFLNLPQVGGRRQAPLAFVAGVFLRGF
jgi:hypothetical protein